MPEDWIPPELEAEGPELLPETAPYWEAWQVLSLSRPSGFGVGAIPISEIKAYLELYQVDDLDERIRYVRLIQAADGEFLKVMAERSKKK